MEMKVKEPSSESQRVKTTLQLEQSTDSIITYIHVSILILDPIIMVG